MKLKQFVFCMAWVMATLQLNAQTGIGTTTPNASAKLDVVASDKGFLPPRVALTATTVFSPVTGLSGATALATAAGLLVYNTATTTNAPNNVVPGYYYWNGTAWIQIAGGLVIDASKNTSFSLGAADNNKLFFISAASTVTVTVPTLPIGFSCQLIQVGAGTVTFAPSSTTLNSASGLSTRTTNSVIGLVMNSATTGYVFGDTIY
jgi:hypothetical protein